MKRAVTKYDLEKAALCASRFFLFALFIFLFCFIGNGLIEKTMIEREKEEFRKRGKFEKEISIEGQTAYLYKVKPKYGYEDDLRPVLREKDGKRYIGSSTDIILTDRNPLRNTGSAFVGDVCAMFSKFLFAGHATAVITGDGTKLIESVGTGEGFHGVRERENDWAEHVIGNLEKKNTVIGLRVKNIKAEKREEIKKLFEAKKGKKYNSLFVFRKNRYYCADLVSRTFREAGIKINHDGFLTTGNDLIVSEKTYPVFMCERDKKGNLKIYYLSGD